jgi:hypothetical protein
MIASSVAAQPPADDSGVSPPVAGQPLSSVPSLEAAPPSSMRPRTDINIALPSENGQYWEEYDLKTYTQHLPNSARPEQALVDWILRETGTDVWFTEPFGIIQAKRDTLRVYHTPAMHQVVKNIYERFVNGTIEPQVFGVRVVTINNPNWRTRAVAWMKSVQVQSPGVQAWLLSKENNAMLLAMLRGRADYREIQTADIVLYNGQSQTLEQLRSRNYVKEYQKNEQGWPTYLPSTTELQEGYRIQFSPLLDTENKTVDVVLKCNIDQVEKLNNVNIELPLPTGQVQVAQINVPQISSWRLHERFRWSTDQVLILSCGVVAAPAGEANNTLLGQGSSNLGLGRLLSGPTGDRADALLFIEYKGNSASMLPTQPQQSAQPATASNNSVSRGRY